MYKNVLNHRDTITVSELRLWTDRARRNHALISYESFSPVISDDAVLLLFSFIKISRLTRELSEEFKLLTPMVSWEKLVNLESLCTSSDSKIIHHISSHYMNEINKLNSCIEGILPHRFN